MRFCQLLVLILVVIGSKAQYGVKVSFIPQINNQEVSVVSPSIISSLGKSIKIDQLKFYVSNLYFSDKDNLVYKWSKTNHLVDLLNNPSSNTLFLDSKIGNFNQIHFQLGIDSLTNVSGALLGDLDPTKGMYWTWQSGYINFKLEGSLIDSNNTDSKFEYHLGGYMPPFTTVQEVSFDVNNSKELRFSIDLEKFISSAKSSGTSKVMSPGVKAKELSIILKNCISLND